jgi:hypothetical protein
MRSDRDKEAEKNYHIGPNLVRIVLHTLREAGSRQDFERKVADFYLMGGRVGRFNHSEKFMAKMVQAMHKVTIGNVNKFLKRTDLATGKPRVFTATADKVTEQHRTCQAVGVLMFDKGEVNVAFVDCILAKDGTCKGLADELIQSCMHDTLRFTREELAQQLVGFAADGQYFANNVAEEIAKQLLP